MSEGEEWDLSAVVRRGAATTTTTTTQSGGGRNNNINNNNNAVGEKALTFEEEEEEKGYFSFPNLSNVGGFDFNTTISSRRSSSSIDELQDSYKPFLSNPITMTSAAPTNINININHSSFSSIMINPSFSNSTATTTTMNPKAICISPTTTTTTTTTTTSTLLINSSTTSSVYGGGESSSHKQQSPQVGTQLQVQSSRQQAGASTSFPMLSMQQPPQPSPPSRKRKNQQKRMVCHLTADNLSDDLWAWRKYGQKPIKGSPYPRNYYRCSSSKGCGARKQVERSNTDSETFIVTYTGEHTHPRPTHRNSLAGSTRNKLPATNNNNVGGLSDSAQPQPIITNNVPSPPSNTTSDLILSPKTQRPVVDPLAFLEDLMNLDDDNNGFDGNAEMIDEMLDEDDGDQDYFFSGRSNN